VQEAGAGGRCRRQEEILVSPGCLFLAVCSWLFVRLPPASCRLLLLQRLIVSVGESNAFALE
jgi:hypothetical protein